jgi:hemoglobin
VTDYERIGGAEGLLPIVEQFVGLAFDDFIIGFLFRGKDRQRVIAKETEHAAAHLGGPAEYTGRALAQVHHKLPINRGHFRRRIALLRKVLAQHRVDPDIIDRWIAHNEALIGQIMARDIDCVD